MTVQLIAHPFRLGEDGRVQTHEQDTIVYLAERIALVLGCRPGERELVPAFGVMDPAYDGLALPSVQNQMNIFEIPATILSVDREDLSNSTTSYRVTFERTEEQSA